VGEFRAVRHEGDLDVVENTITGKSYLLNRMDIIVNCDDPMVECGGFEHILSSACNE